MADIQQLENTQSQVTYTGNGVTTEFPTTFAFLEDDHLVVESSDDDGDTWTELTLDDDYTVDGAGEEEPGGTVTTDVAVANGDKLRITRETPITQLAELQTSGPLPSKTIIQGLVKVTMWGQEMKRQQEELQALQDLVVISGADATHVTKDFTTDADAVEETFPFQVDCVGGNTARGGALNVYLRSDTSHRFDTPPFVQWVPGPGNKITVVAIDGLDPAKDYTVSGVVFIPS